MKRTLIILSAITLLGAATFAADSEEGFVSLMDGKTFNGWKKAAESPETWTVQGNEFVAHGPRCHLFYVGDEKPFKNFHFKAEVMTKPGSNGGIYFHTAYQEKDWPKQGFESQVNTTHSDWIKTGSLYGVVNVGHAFSKDNQWWTQEIIVNNKTVTVKVDGVTVLAYTEPEGAKSGSSFTRTLAGGTFALQGHDPKSEIHYRNIRVKRLD
jgi:hypothetical protein